MTLHVRDAGTWKEVTAPAVRDAGVWKNLTEGHVRDAGVWKQFFSSALLASAAPTTQTKYGFDFGGGVEITSDDITASATGGNGNYTYAWSHVSGTVFSNYGTTGAVIVLYHTLYGFSNLTGVYRCSVNDTASNGPVLTNTVSVTFESEA